MVRESGIDFDAIDLAFLSVINLLGNVSGRKPYSKRISCE